MLFRSDLLVIVIGHCMSVRPNSFVHCAKAIQKSWVFSPFKKYRDYSLKSRNFAFRRPPSKNCLKKIYHLPEIILLDEKKLCLISSLLSKVAKKMWLWTEQMFNPQNLIPVQIFHRNSINYEVFRSSLRLLHIAKYVLFNNWLSFLGIYCYGFQRDPYIRPDPCVQSCT